MKVAVVGTSDLTENETDSVKCVIENLNRKFQYEGSTVITGDAETGVDYLARMWFSRQILTVIKSEGSEWKYYKERNTQIAREADYIISITTKIKNQKCYHCNQDHQRTGGCWTLKCGKMLGKKGEVIVI